MLLYFIDSKTLISTALAVLPLSFHGIDGKT